MMHELRGEQRLPVPIDEAWAFISSPRNLARITPQDMGFVIRAGADSGEIAPDQRISYTVRPVWGIPLRWVTRITLVEAPFRFVDEQERGPYAYWRHEHELLPDGDGTLMRDRVLYRPPLGPLGELMHPLVIAPRLRAIFAYRRTALERIFPKEAASHPITT